MSGSSSTHPRKELVASKGMAVLPRIHTRKATYSRGAAIFQHKRRCQILKVISALTSIPARRDGAVGHMM